MGTIVVGNSSGTPVLACCNTLHRMEEYNSALAAGKRSYVPLSQVEADMEHIRNCGICCQNFFGRSPATGDRREFFDPTAEK